MGTIANSMIVTIPVVLGAASLLAAIMSAHLFFNKGEDGFYGLMFAVCLLGAIIGFK